MHRDPSLDLDSDGAYLFLVDPDSAIDGESFAVEMKFFKGLDDRLFKISHPSVQVFAVFGNIKDGISDELSWSVIRDVTAPICWQNLDSILLVPAARVKQVFGVKARSQGYDGIVFEKEEDVFGSILNLGENV